MSAMAMLPNSQGNFGSERDKRMLRCVVLNRREGRFIQVFQRLLSLEPFEDEKRMNPECPQ
jgi:hypothetical protein